MKYTMKIPEAASILGVTDRTVRNYIKKGLLSRQRISRSSLLDPIEVEELRLDFQSEFPTLSRKEFLKLKTTVRRLESHMEVVLRMLDTKMQPLGIGEEYSRELYQLAAQHLTERSSWRAEEIAPWIEIFDRLSENDFMVLCKATDNPKAWLVFLRLNVRMSECVVGDREYATSLELQNLHKLLSEARRRLRISAFIYSEMMGNLEEELNRYGLIEAPKSTAESLFSKLLKTK